MADLAISVTTDGTSVYVTTRIDRRSYRLPLEPDEAKAFAMHLDEAVALTHLVSGPCGEDVKRA